MAGCVDASLLVRVLDAHPTVVPVWEQLVQRGGELIAPYLLHYEVANALFQQQRAGLLSAELAALQLNRCLYLPIELHGDTRLHERAFELAGEHHLPATYDAHYLALAERFRVPLWTCDHRLADAARGGSWDVHLVP